MQAILAYTGIAYLLTLLSKAQLLWSIYRIISRLKKTPITDKDRFRTVMVDLLANADKIAKLTDNKIDDRIVKAARHIVADNLLWAAIWQSITTDAVNPEEIEKKRYRLRWLNRRRLELEGTILPNFPEEMEQSEVDLAVKFIAATHTILA